jgi:hypothetical protein
MASAAEKPVFASGVDAGDAARRRNVAAPQAPVITPAEADDKKKQLKKVRICPRCALQLPSPRFQCRLLDVVA